MHYVDVGTSGGVWGLERGYCMMIGGEVDIVHRLDPIFKQLAPGVGNIPRTPGRDNVGGTAELGYLHCGPNGAGHFVKMVHNGIEYGLMAAYAEGLGILRQANIGTQQAAVNAETTPLRDAEHYQYELNLRDITEVWRRGSVIASWLLDLTAAALVEDPALSRFAGRVSDSGEGRWTIKAAVDEAVRAIPGLVTLRPADANEAVEDYRYVMQLRHTPAVLALSRQPLPTLDRDTYASASGVARGGYVLADAPGGDPEVILIASGSEVTLAIDAHEKLRAEGIRARVVSMPLWEIFDHQPDDYRENVLPSNVTARISVEQASTFGWERYVGASGRMIGMRTFGASAPLKELQRKFGFEPDRVAEVAKALVSRASGSGGVARSIG